MSEIFFSIWLMSTERGRALNVHSREGRADNKPRTSLQTNIIAIFQFWSLQISISFGLLIKMADDERLMRIINAVIQLFACWFELFIHQFVMQLGLV